MKRIGVLVATTTALLATLMAVPAGAQQAAPGTDPHHSAPQAGAAPAPAAPTPATPGAGMSMCHQMMADMAAMPTMRSGVDGREQADMLQMRGEMMKAMGEIMMKHARRMQTAPTK